MEWDNGANIGFNAAGDPYDNYNPSSSEVACLNIQFTNWSNVDYLLSSDSPEIPVPVASVTSVNITSAVISWTISRFIQSEVYYVQYGTEETTLDIVTSSIPSPADTSLVNQTYSTSLQGLMPSTMYYFRVAAVYNVDFGRYSEIMSFRTFAEEQAVYLPFLSHTDTYLDSGVLDSCNDCSSSEIVFPNDLPFGGSFHQSAYISINGLVSFGRSVSSFVPQLFPTATPEVYWSYVLAPFWADFVTGADGLVSWELHDMEHSPLLLQKVNMFIQTQVGTSFNGTWMLVAFWENIDDYANTFQAIVVTDGTKSYSVFTYKCEELEWPFTATIGYNVPLMDYENSPFSGNSADSVACSHLNSPWTNIVYNLQPGSVILPTTPMPSSFIGSCVEAGYTECCEGEDCVGSPDDCFCDASCVLYGDCCYDYPEICSNTTVPPAYNLLVAVGPSLATVHYEGSDSYIVRTNYSENALAVDFNYESSKVYWSHTDLDYDTPAKIYSANLNGSQEEVLIDSYLLFVSDIAVDWIAGNLYWVDSAWARIEALSLDTLNRTEILRTGANTNPSGIAVDPLTRYMFWSDVGAVPHIERVSMDGSGRRVIIYSDISRPVGITIDITDQRVYWSDTDLYRIESCNYYGDNRLIVETEASGLLYPFSLTVANNLLFWTDWITDSVYATHKQHGSDFDNGYFQLIATFSSHPFGIEALLEGRQQQADNPCLSSMCSHLCLLSSTDERGYLCVCSEGYTLEPDDFSCKPINDSETPPSEGSCSTAGYTSCCTHGYCAGYPPTCSCHPDCTIGVLGCCSDFADLCPSVSPLQPTGVAVVSDSASAQIYWTVSQAVFGLETYVIEYGVSMNSLDMQSDTLIGELDTTNTTYSITLGNLEPLTTYYYRVRAQNLAGVTFTNIHNFTTSQQIFETSSITVAPGSTAGSQSLPVTTDTQPTINPTSSNFISTPATSQILPSLTQTVVNSVTSQLTGGTEITSTTTQSSSVRAISRSATPSLTETRPSLSSTGAVLASTTSSVADTLSSSLQPSPPASQQPTPSVSAGIQSSSPVPSAPTTSQTEPSETDTQTTAYASESSIPVVTKLPSAIEENSVKVTLSDYDLKSFTVAVQLKLKSATAVAVNVYCARYSCQTVKLKKRELLEVESDDVGILDISDSSMGVSVVTYVLVGMGEVLNGDNLLASIQNGLDIFENYGFSSVTAERQAGEEPEGGGSSKSGSGGLSAGAIAGIAVAALLITLAVVLTAAFIFYRIRKKGLYKVSGLVDGFDSPVTDRFFEFGVNSSQDDVRKNPLYEEAEGKL